MAYDLARLNNAGAKEVEAAIERLANNENLSQRLVDLSESIAVGRLAVSGLAVDLVDSHLADNLAYSLVDSHLVVEGLAVDLVDSRLIDNIAVGLASSGLAGSIADSFAAGLAGGLAADRDAAGSLANKRAIGRLGGRLADSSRVVESPAVGDLGARLAGSSRVVESLAVGSLAESRLDSRLADSLAGDSSRSGSESNYATEGAILAFVVSRSLAALVVIVLVAAEVAAGPDSPTDDYQLPEAVPGEHIALARSTTEPFTGVVQAYIDDPANTGLDQASENYLRAQLTKLRAEYTIIEGADSADIRRTIGKIVKRLLVVGQFGEQTRELLIELGGEPIEAVDEVVEDLDITLHRIAAEWADEAEPEQRNNKATIASIDESATTAEVVGDKIRGFVDQTRVDVFVADVYKGAGTQLGKRAVDGSTVGLGSLAGYLVARYGIDIDAIMFHLAHSLGDLRTVFLHRSDE